MPRTHFKFNPENLNYHELDYSPGARVWRVVAYVAAILVIAVLLNGQNQLLAERLIADGTPTQTSLHVRRIMEEALRVSASTLVLVHNHPSGCFEPSDDDNQTTSDVEAAARILGILFLDHIIVGETGHYSYADAGVLDKLKQERS